MVPPRFVRANTHRIPPGVRTLVLDLTHAHEMRFTALTALERSVEAFPQNLALQHLLARLLAASQQASVRDGERALEVARQLVTTRASLEHVETLAMALAELGRFDEAVARQRDVVRQLETAGEVTGLSTARMRLELYESGEPCRAPWLGG